MKYKAAIFDFDGTLLDTLEDLADSMNDVLADFGMPIHPADPYRYFVGDGMVNLARRAAPAGTDDATVRDMAQLMNDKYARRWSNKSAPYAGIQELIDALRKRGLRLGLLSNKPDSFTREMARHYFPGSVFEVVFGARDTVPRKPDPAGALEIARIMEIAPADFLYFGDTNTDMQTGRSAGMFTIGVSWGFRPVKELLDAGAQTIIDTPAQALTLLDDGKGTT